MVLPNKYVPIEESIVGLGAYALSDLSSPMTVSDLWMKMSKHPQVATFERFVLAVDFLFTLGAIYFEGDRLIRRGA